MSLPTLEVIPVETEVGLYGGQRAVVTGVCLYPGNRVSYQCHYWNGGSYESKWFEAFLVSSVSTERQIIGFKHKETSKKEPAP